MSMSMDDSHGPLFSQHPSVQEKTQPPSPPRQTSHEQFKRAYDQFQFVQDRDNVNVDPGSVPPTFSEVMNAMGDDGAGGMLGSHGTSSSSYEYDHMEEPPPLSSFREEEEAEIEKELSDGEIPMHNTFHSQNNGGNYATRRASINKRFGSRGTTFNSSKNKSDMNAYPTTTTGTTTGTTIGTTTGTTTSTTTASVTPKSNSLNYFRKYRRAQYESSHGRMREIQNTAATTIQSIYYIMQAKAELTRRRRRNVLNMSKNLRMRHGMNVSQQEFYSRYTEDRDVPSPRSSSYDSYDKKPNYYSRHRPESSYFQEPVKRNNKLVTTIQQKARRPARKRREEYLPRKAYKSALINVIPKGHPDQMIHLAGLRLLSAAAIPIQTEMRRYMAQQHAYSRYWATITIQCYIRRWISEDYLFAHVIAATKIQAAFRGWIERDSLDDEHYCATEIQRIVRGYLGVLHYEDDLCRIIIVQSIVRRNFAIDKAIDKITSILAIQSLWRGFTTRRELSVLATAASKIQTIWRRFSAQLRYQFDLVDIIIVQSVVRRWRATRQVKYMKMKHLGGCAVIIQAKWRCYYRSMTYLHTIADILIVQSVIRRWIAFKKYPRLLLDRQTQSAITIQRYWRGHVAHFNFLLSLVHIIIIQSVARRYMARKRYKAELVGLHTKMAEKREICATKIQKTWRGFVDYSNYVVVQFEHHSATTIQKYWRGFWDYSHFVILQFEVVRIQTAYRGYIARKTFELRKEKIVTLQCFVRQILARKKFQLAKMINLFTRSRLIAFQTSVCCKRIQRWYRAFLQARKEKTAALVIERFFLLVKVEVDKEIKKRKKKQQIQRRKKKEADDKFLERVWLNTVKEEEFSVAQEPKRPEPVGIPKRTLTKVKQNPHQSMIRNSSSYIEPSRHRYDEYNDSNGYGRRPSSTRSAVSRRGNVGNAYDPAFVGYERKQHGESRYGPGGVGAHSKRQISSNRGKYPPNSYMSPPPTDHVAMPGDNNSEVSGITSPSVFYSRGGAHHHHSPRGFSRYNSLSKKDMDDDYSLEEAWIDTEIHQVKERRKNDNQYMQRHGLNIAQSYNNESPMHASQRNMNPSSNRMIRTQNRRPINEEEEFDPILSRHTSYDGERTRQRPHPMGGRMEPARNSNRNRIAPQHSSSESPMHSAHRNMNPSSNRMIRTQNSMSQPRRPTNEGDESRHTSYDAGRMHQRPHPMGGRMEPSPNSNRNRPVQQQSPIVDRRREV